MTRIGLAVCGLVVATTAVLVGIRLVAGPRTVHHDPCPAAQSDTTCVRDRYTGSPVARPWLILLGTLSVCSGAVATSLRQHDRELGGPPFS